MDGSAIRIVVVGHVDHGKSTLIGRLMYDLGLLHQSKLDEVHASSARRGGPTEWSYVLDSLQEERDQAVTIDTTRLWFSHGGRRYVIIDAPGHRQFIANMLTGASEADAAILVVDAVAGVREQTLRHAYLLGFLGIRHVIVAINKIDVLADAEARVREVAAQVQTALRGPRPSAVVPISASLGENVAARAASTPWYDGPTVLEALAAVRAETAPAQRPVRLNVQDVYRRAGERAVVGTVSAGTLAPGDRLTLLPAGVAVTAERLVRWPQGEVQSAAPGDAVAVVLDGDPFVRRGDVLADVAAPADVTRDISLELFWLHPQAPQPNDALRLRRGTQTADVVVDSPPTIYDIEAAHTGDAEPRHNIVSLRVRAADPVAFDPRDADPVGARCVVLRGLEVAGIGFAV